MIWNLDTLYKKSRALPFPFSLDFPLRFGGLSGAV